VVDLSRRVAVDRPEFCCRLIAIQQPGRAGDGLFLPKLVGLSAGRCNDRASGTPDQRGPCSIGFPAFGDFVTDFLQHASQLPDRQSDAPPAALAKLEKIPCAFQRLLQTLSTFMPSRVHCSTF
jgi:hypothetical protein